MVQDSQLSKPSFHFQNPAEVLESARFIAWSQESFYNKEKVSDDANDLDITSRGQPLIYATIPSTFSLQCLQCQIVR